MRMDFNRVGGPNRALSRDDTRVVPVAVVKKTEKPKNTKNIAKGTDIARVSNPKSAGGGKGKEVASTPALRIPAPLAEIYDVTGGNLDDISKFAELASWLKTGLPGLDSPLFLGKGDGSFVPPTLGAVDRFGWGDTKGGPGNGTPQRIGNPDGKVAGDVWRVTRSGPTGNGGVWIEIYNKQENRYEVEYFDPGEHFVSRYAPGDQPGTSLPESTTRKVIIPDNEPIVITAGENPSEKEVAEEETTEKEKDSQPTEEGTGRPRGMRTVRCDIAGCLDLGMTDGLRVNPGHAEGSGAASGGGRALPSWATDPCPDCTSRGGGSGYSGYDPRNEGDGDVGGDGGRGTPM
jgi:hypothetical protein